MSFNTRSGRLWQALFCLVALAPIGTISQGALSFNAEFDPPSLIIDMDTVKMVNLTITNMINVQEGDVLQIRSNNSNVAIVNADFQLMTNTNTWKGLFNVTGFFLGKTTIDVAIKSRADAELHRAQESLQVIVVRKERIINHIFIASVATLVSLIYINFGCALDMDVVKATIKRPIGPLIGFVTQFLFMPVISYILGLVLFKDDVYMRLGMFFTGVSPGGGASNIWTVLLKGNQHLSITMTTISTIAAFGMMPLWLFTLGHHIFAAGDIVVPYRNIATFAIGLVIPLGLGILAQRYLPRFSKFMARILKGFSGVLIIFIVVFATLTNLYLFELFTWRIVLAGLGVPWLGYLVGWLGGRAFQQSGSDCMAIALETGIQNTGIPIFLLKFTLEQPAADLTTVVPVAVAIMTPLPLIVMYLYQLIRNRERNAYIPVQADDPS